MLLVLTGSSDNTAKIWDAETGKELLTLKGHADTVTSAVFSPDERRVLTRSSDKTAKIWDVESGKELLTLKGHADRVHSSAFSPDGRRVLTASWSSARIWNAVDWTLTKEEFLEQKRQRYEKWVKANLPQPE